VESNNSSPKAPAKKERNSSVAGEPLGEASVYHDDRVFVQSRSVTSPRTRKTQLDVLAAAVIRSFIGR
jgi:hypothetical protein